jgi:hypothetical protein
VTLARFARLHRIGERQAEREANAAAARYAMHLQIDDQVGIERSRKNHLLKLGNTGGNAASLRPPRRFVDGLIEDRLDTPPAAGRSPRLRRSQPAGCRSPKEPNAMQITTKPAALVAELEAMPLGEPIAVLLGEATNAIAADRAAAVAIMFPADIVRADAGTLGLYTFHTSRYDRPGFDARMATLHGRALSSAPELCLLLRSPEALADIEAAASALASPRHERESYAEAQTRAAAEARVRYERAIAEQLAAAGGDLAEPARRLIAAEDLAARVEAARQRHEQAAAAAAERAAAERRAAQVATEADADASALEVELSQLCRSHGLPADLRSGIFIEGHRQRLALLVRARRRLAATPVDGVRVHLGGMGPGLYSCRQLSTSIANESASTLTAIISELDRREAALS